MKIRNGFVSNSSSSSFILASFDDGAISVYNKRIKDFEEWTPKDVKKWVVSMIKRESKKCGSELSDKFIEENVKIDKLVNLLEPLKLSYWYPGLSLLHSASYILYDTSDNLISSELADKILKKFDVNVKDYKLHMG